MSRCPNARGAPVAGRNRRGPEPGTTRRALLRGLALGILVMPSRLSAQPPGRAFRIGLLDYESPFATAAFADALRELGYADGQRLIIEARVNRAESLLPLAHDLASLPVDVLVSVGTPATLAAKRAAPKTPIVFTMESASTPCTDPPRSWST